MARKRKSKKRRTVAQKRATRKLVAFNRARAQAHKGRKVRSRKRKKRRTAAH